MNKELCQYTLRDLAETLLDIEGFEAIGDRRRRHDAIIRAVFLANKAGLDSGFRPLGDANGQITYPIPESASKVVAYIVLPIKKQPDSEEYTQAQVAYFIDNEFITPWDGHDRQTKLKRIAEFLCQSYYPVKERPF